MALTRFEGNCPKTVARVGKYTVRHTGSGLVIGLVYDTPEGERWFMTTEDHPELVEMVRAVKIELTGNPAGAFYINEYNQVIVPAAGTEDYFLAGEYDKRLRFEFQGRILSGEPVSEDGDPLQPGDEWTGPRAGIPYTLSAGGNDVYYILRPRPRVERKVLLSQATSPEAAHKFASRIRGIKGFQGGRFYINEWRAMFTPLEGASGWKYVYLGQLGADDPWFPKPHA